MNMTSDEYRAALDRLGINQQAAGRVFEVGSRTARRWALGEARVPAAIAMLLQLMLKKRLKLEIPIIKEGLQRVNRHQTWIFSAERKLE